MAATHSFGQLYEIHIWRVYGFFAYRVQSRADAEDLTQQTFEKALRGWSRYDESKGSQATWLTTIARNVLIDHFRRDRSAQQDPIGDGGISEDQLPGDAPEADLGLGPELAAALASLNERDREIIALRFGADMTGPEIAELTGLTLANVQQILSRSLRRMRATLEPSSV